MANVLKMMMVEAIHSPRSAGLSCRENARRLGNHRETVSWHLRRCRELISKPASALIFPAGSEVGVAGFSAEPGPEVAGFDPPTARQSTSKRGGLAILSSWKACGGQGGIVCVDGSRLVGKRSHGHRSGADGLVGRGSVHIETIAARIAGANVRRDGMGDPGLVRIPDDPLPPTAQEVLPRISGPPGSPDRSPLRFKNHSPRPAR